MRRSLLRVLVVVLVLGLLLWGWTRLPIADVPADSQAHQLAFAEQKPVAVWETEVEDTTRPTSARGSFTGAASRVLKLRVWQPDAINAPLLVYSHGFGGNRNDADQIMRHLASLGFLVVAPSFPSTNTFAPRGPKIGDVVNQPADQRFVIDRLLEWNQTEGHALKGRIDPTRIGALGISLGGLTTVLMVFDPARHDPRIKAAVSIAGLHYMFAREYYSRAIPFLEIAGSKDAVVPLEWNAKQIPAEIAGSLLVSIAGGTHTGFSDFAPSLRFMSHEDTIACMFIKRSIEKGDTGTWTQALGATPGVRDPETHSCEEGMLTGPTLDPREQQRIAAVAAGAFFQSQFAANAGTRQANDAYLRTGLSKDFAAATVTSAP